MSEVPILPGAFVESLVQEDLRRWMTAEADQAAGYSLNSTAKSLVPTLRMSSNATLGLEGRASEGRGDSVLGKEDRRCLRLWFSEQDDHLAAVLANGFRSMRWFSHPVIITLAGNRQGISYRFTVHRQETMALRNLLAGLWPHDHVEEESDGLDPVLGDVGPMRLIFRTIRPPTPYWGVFESQGLESVSLFPAIAALPADALAIYQVVLRPMPAEACVVIRHLMKAEELVGQTSYVQHRGWIPSPDALRRAEEKAAGPLFGVALRLGVFAQERCVAEGTVDSLLLPIASLHFSGGPVDLLTEGDLIQAGIGSGEMANGFIDGTTYQPGIVVSPTELAMFLRLPTEGELKNRAYPLDLVSPLAANCPAEVKGIKIAEETVFGQTRDVIWPDSLRNLHLMVTGATGFGKTIFLAELGAAIANAPKHVRDEGFAFIDPHDKGIVELCCRLSESQLDDVILCDANDREHVFCLPLMDCPDREEIDTAVSNISHQFFALFHKADMGFNIERGIRNGTRTILLCPNLSLLNARHLFSQTRIGEKCRDAACAQIDDEMLVDYWQNEFKHLDGASLGRIRSRFEYLLEPKRMRALLANKIRKISFREIMDGNKIMLFRISAGGGGADITNILGTLYLTGLLTAANSRSGSEGRRSIKMIMADEFGNYSNPRTIPHSLRTLRRCDVSIVLATQNIYALPDEVKEAIGNIDTHVVFQQGWDDAQAYFKAFCGMVPAADFMMKNPGEGYAKVGRRLAAITCPMSPRLRGPEVLEEIRENTRRRYCVPFKEFKERMIEEHHVSLDDMKELDLL